MPKNPTSTTVFVGREWELSRFQEILQTDGAKIVVVYGRRRVGKTTLIHRALARETVFLFEGLQGQPAHAQLQHFAEQMAVQFRRQEMAKTKLESWKDAFLRLDAAIGPRQGVIYLEEVQWMAGYQDNLVSELKFVWDNCFKKNRRLTLVLCGSSPSFLIQNVMQSKALHNRSQWEMPVPELPFGDAVELMGRHRDPLELLDGYLAMGGIPEYLRLLNSKSSIYLSLTHHAFPMGAYFAHEAERVFVSSLAERPAYRQIIECLAKKGPQTKGKVLEAIGQKSGGVVTDLFDDLYRCGFIYPYSPIAFGEVARDCKWMIRDAYLQFYFRLIAPKLSKIDRGEFNNQPTLGLSHTEFRKWLGLAFERFCLFHQRAFASVLGFSGVEYEVGPFYLRNRAATGQLDLVFRRKDRVNTICEIKYQVNPPGQEIIKPMEETIGHLPLSKRGSIQRVLISPNGASASLVNHGYFDQIIDWNRLRPALDK